MPDTNAYIKAALEFLDSEATVLALFRYRAQPEPDEQHMYVALAHNPFTGGPAWAVIHLRVRDSYADSVTVTDQEEFYERSDAEQMFLKECTKL